MRHNRSLIKTPYISVKADSEAQAAVMMSSYMN